MADPMKTGGGQGVFSQICDEGLGLGGEGVIVIFELYAKLAILERIAYRMFIEMARIAGLEQQQRHEHGVPEKACAVLPAIRPAGVHVLNICHRRLRQKVARGVPQSRPGSMPTMIGS